MDLPIQPPDPIVVTSEISTGPNGPDPVNTAIGARLKLRRLAARLSQERLAESIGLTYQQVQKYEKGMTRISARRLQQLATALGVPVSSFFEDAGNDARPVFHLPASSASEALSPLSDDEQRLLNAFRKIAADTLKRRIIGLVESLSDD